MENEEVRWPIVGKTCWSTICALHGSITKRRKRKAQMFIFYSPLKTNPCKLWYFQEITILIKDTPSRCLMWIPLSPCHDTESCYALATHFTKLTKKGHLQRYEELSWESNRNSNTCLLAITKHETSILWDFNTIS